MFYEVEYKCKWDKKKSLVKFYNKDEVLSIIKQINRWLTPIKDRLINWFDSLDYIIVIEQNYDYEKDWFHYDYEKISHNWEIIEIPELSTNINKNFLPKRKDITAELFYECDIGHLDDETINYKNWILTIYNEVYPLNKNTKYWEMFDLIFSTYNKISKKEFEYANIFITFENKEYKRLKEKDLKYEIIRNTIKDKLKEIKEYYKMKKNIIYLSIDTITINN